MSRRGRPPLALDHRVIADLAYLGHSNRQIAEVCGCHAATFTHRADYAAILLRARHDRAAAIDAAYRGTGGHVSELVALIEAAERRAIQRSNLPPRSIEQATDAGRAG